jgi:hypothetical protein
VAEDVSDAVAAAAGIGSGKQGAAEHQREAKKRGLERGTGQECAMSLECKRG